SGDHAFSVAQHSLLVEALFGELVPEAPADARLAALLHDAPEYVIGDMISPFKSVMGGSYKECELRLQRAIHLRFSLPVEPSAGLRKEIKRADQVAAYFEATLLAGFSTAEATEFFGRPRGFNADRFDFTPHSVTWAQNAFLERYAAIEKLRRQTVQPAD
ncbi:MAG: HD family hydrolase, partial [Mesorhizobium sp.]